MAKEQGEEGAVRSFLGDIGKAPRDPFKSTDPFAPKESDQSVADEESNEGGEEEGEEQKPVAFHKDPKILKFIEREVGKRVASIKPTESAKPSEDGDEVAAFMASFTKVLGNDTPDKVAALELLQKTLRGMGDRAAAQLVQRMEEESQRQQAEEDAYAQEIDESFEAIEEVHNVDISSNTAPARKLRNDFIDYVRKIAHKNEEGEVDVLPDLTSAWEEFAERGKRPASTRAKDLASRSISRSADTSAAPKATGKSWKDIDRIFDKLGGN